MFLHQPRPVNGVFAALSLMTAGCGIAHGTFYLPTRCLRWHICIDWPALCIAMHTPLQYYCNLCLRDPSSDSAYASLRNPVHTSKNANSSTTQDIL